MTIEGEDLGAELYDMRLAGRVTLPSVAAVFAQGTRHVHNSSWRERETFESEDSRYQWRYGEDVDSLPGDDAGLDIDIEAGTSMGVVYGPWIALRDTAQWHMAATANALSDAGAALNMIADAYAQRDDEAGAELDRLSRANLDDLVPPETPEVKYPHSSHDTHIEEDRVIGIPGTDIGWDVERELPDEEPIDPLDD